MLKKDGHCPSALFDLPPEPFPHPSGEGVLPLWLAEELRAENPNRYLTKATWTRCRKCKAIVQTGLDDPVIASPAMIDPTPLTPLQDLTCALTHRTTYRLFQAGTETRISHRDQFNRHHPAGEAGQPPIVPAHRCGARFPGFTIPPQPERTHDDRPDF
jgi:hypothetical protein